MTNVLLAIDGPLYGKVIVDFVVNHQWVPGTNFKLIYAVEPPRGMEAWPEVRTSDDEAIAAKKMLDEMATRVEKSLPNCKAFYEVCLGFPKEEILTQSNEWPADMIVMGSHGRTALQRFLMGSVSLSVMMHAPCSTVVVRIQEKGNPVEQKRLKVERARDFPRAAK